MSVAGPHLSGVIPVYNERATIEELLKRVQTAPTDKEIIVVDDGSTDGTRELLAGMQTPDGSLRVILQERNRGKGAALRRGFAAARGAIVLRAEVLHGIRLREDRFGFEAEVTAKVARGPWRVYEVPISYHGRTYAKGKKITWKDGVRGVWCTLRYGMGG